MLDYNIQDCGDSDFINVLFQDFNIVDLSIYVKIDINCILVYLYLLTSSSHVCFSLKDMQKSILYRVPLFLWVCLEHTVNHSIIIVHVKLILPQSWRDRDRVSSTGAI